RAKTGRRGQDDHVGQCNGLFVGVKADELLVIADGRFFAMLLLQFPEAAVQPVLEGIGHGDEFGVPGGAEGLIGRAGAPAAAPDQGNIQTVAAGGVRAALEAQPAKERSADNRSGSFKEIPTRRRRGRSRAILFIHGLVVRLNYSFECQSLHGLSSAANGLDWLKLNASRAVCPTFPIECHFTAPSRLRCSSISSSPR